MSLARFIRFEPIGAIAFEIRPFRWIGRRGANADRAIEQLLLRGMDLRRRQLSRAGLIALEQRVALRDAGWIHRESRRGGETGKRKRDDASLARDLRLRPAPYSILIGP